MYEFTRRRDRLRRRDVFGSGLEHTIRVSIGCSGEDELVQGVERMGRVLAQA
ncbi:MAG: hypothetical protein WA705_17780 [Candidatus Ozemobacteraceae bacterium]